MTSSQFKTSRQSSCLLDRRAFRDRRVRAWKCVRGNRLLPELVMDTANCQLPTANW